MVTRTKVLGLAAAVLFALTLVQGTAFGHRVSVPVEPQGKTPTTPSEPLNSLNDTEMLLSGSNAPSVPSAVQADAENVEFVGYIDTPGVAGTVTIAGSYAYVADGDSGLRVIDVTTPSHPTEVGFYTGEGPFGDVTVAGNYAYLAEGYTNIGESAAQSGGGLRVVDISTPANPKGVSFYDTPSHLLTSLLLGTMLTSPTEWKLK